MTCSTQLSEKDFSSQQAPRQDDVKRKIENMSYKKEGQASTCNQPLGGHFRSMISNVQF